MPTNSTPIQPPIRPTEWVEPSGATPSQEDMYHHCVQNLAGSDGRPIEPLLATHRRLHRWSLVAAAVACVASFGVGFWVSGRRLESRALESGRRQVEEFVIFADSLGFLDRTKLEEAIVASETEWEDRDAAQQAEGGRP